MTIRGALPYLYIVCAHSCQWCVCGVCKVVNPRCSGFNSELFDLNAEDFISITYKENTFRKEAMALLLVELII